MSRSQPYQAIALEAVPGEASLPHTRQHRPPRCSHRHSRTRPDCRFLPYNHPESLCHAVPDRASSCHVVPESIAHSIAHSHPPTLKTAPRPLETPLKGIGPAGLEDAATDCARLCQVVPGCAYLCHVSAVGRAFARRGCARLCQAVPGCAREHCTLSCTLGVGAPAGTLGNLCYSLSRLGSPHHGRHSHRGNRATAPTTECAVASAQLYCRRPLSLDRAHAAAAEAAIAVLRPASR
ncbi:MAG: hypothetical protein ACI85K_001445 [Hyphomicrobiaceae bacterium]